MHTQEPRRAAEPKAAESRVNDTADSEAAAARARANANPRDEAEGRLPTDARRRSYDRPAAEIRVNAKGLEKHHSLAGGVAWHVSDATKVEITHDPLDQTHAYLRALTHVGDIGITVTSGDIRGEATFSLKEISAAADSEKALTIDVESPL